jgi:hypothetical protein
MNDIAAWNELLSAVTQHHHAGGLKKGTLRSLNFKADGETAEKTQQVQYLYPFASYVGQCDVQGLGNCVVEDLSIRSMWCCQVHVFSPLI